MRLCTSWIWKERTSRIMNAIWIKIWQIAADGTISYSFFRYQLYYINLSFYKCLHYIGVFEWINILLWNTAKWAFSSAGCVDNLHNIATFATFLLCVNRKTSFFPGVPPRPPDINPFDLEIQKLLSVVQFWVIEDGSLAVSPVSIFSILLGSESEPRNSSR